MFESRISAGGLEKLPFPQNICISSWSYDMVGHAKKYGMIDDLDNVDFLSSNVHSSRQEALLYVFEDNEVVIKMIKKGRSPRRHTDKGKFHT